MGSEYSNAFTCLMSKMWDASSITRFLYKESVFEDHSHRNCLSPSCDTKDGLFLRQAILLLIHVLAGQRCQVRVPSRVAQTQKWQPFLWKSVKVKYHLLEYPVRIHLQLASLFQSRSPRNLMVGLLCLMYSKVTDKMCEHIKTWMSELPRVSWEPKKQLKKARWTSCQLHSTCNLSKTSTRCNSI